MIYPTKSTHSEVQMDLAVKMKLKYSGSNNCALLCHRGHLDK